MLLFKSNYLSNLVNLIYILFKKIKNLLFYLYKYLK